jgi:Na+-transporting methylmalonyl-CoA/oxaloacetate decarboxylase gamma subunit
MIAVAEGVGAILLFVVTIWFLIRWISRVVSRSSPLGTVSRQWLELHRAEDK